MMVIPSMSFATTFERSLLSFLGGCMNNSDPPVKVTNVVVPPPYPLLKRPLFLGTAFFPEPVQIETIVETILAPFCFGRFHPRSDDTILHERNESDFIYFEGFCE